MRSLGRKRSSPWNDDFILFHNNYLVNQAKAPEDKSRDLGFLIHSATYLNPKKRI